MCRVLHTFDTQSCSSPGLCFLGVEDFYDIMRVSNLLREAQCFWQCELSECNRTTMQVAMCRQVRHHPAGGGCGNLNQQDDYGLHR